jgi:hypothetical protein
MFFQAQRYDARKDHGCLLAERQRSHRVDHLSRSKAHKPCGVVDERESSTTVFLLKTSLIRNNPQNSSQVIMFAEQLKRSRPEALPLLHVSPTERRGQPVLIKLSVALT